MSTRSAMPGSLRTQRRHNAGEEDQRNCFQRDRDRIHYSSAFRRLGGVSQVVSVDHIEPFHTRLTHTTKVAQLGRRLAEFMLQSQEVEAKEAGIDPDVVEAACLAHDLGHPPFGHVGEDVLNKRVRDHDDTEGFEGNAQSFRILTKLALRSFDVPGLDLTRAVLAASIKYPWSPKEAATKGTPKFGYYASEQDDFNFAREEHKHEGRTVEAALMDYADDIAYSVHDLEDFHRIRAVPWNLLGVYRDAPVTSKAGEIIAAAREAWYNAPPDAQQKLETAATNLIGRLQKFPFIYDEPYEGTKDQRISLRIWTSDLIRRFVRDLPPVIRKDSNGIYALILNEEAHAEIILLKQITRQFIIDGTTIGAQQYGQTCVVGEVFDALYKDIKNFRMDSRKLKVTPKRFHYLIEDSDLSVTIARLAADCIASLTENELISLHKRLRGLVGGSIIDPIVR